MAVTAAKIANTTDTVIGNKKMRTRRLTFSGNYATGGEAITPALFGLNRRIEQLLTPGGVAMASNVATGIAVGWNAATSKLVFFESAASAAAFLEKDNAEAYPTGCFIDVTVIGV